MPELELTTEIVTEIVINNEPLSCVEITYKDQDVCIWVDAADAPALVARIEGREESGVIKVLDADLRTSAEEIEGLKAENERLREAISHIRGCAGMVLAKNALDRISEGR